MGENGKSMFHTKIKFEIKIYLSITSMLDGWIKLSIKWKNWMTFGSHINDLNIYNKIIKKIIPPA